MAYTTTSITARIEWCRRQSMESWEPLEIAGWRAEAEGLEDALLHRDHTTQYQQGPPSMFKRYALGLQDGHAMMRTAAVDQHSPTPAHKPYKEVDREGRTTYRTSLDERAPRSHEEGSALSSLRLH